MKKLNLVSLGISCQTTHQLSRYAQENPETVTFHKGPFDWLICPLQSSAHWIDAGLPDFHSNEIVVERDHAYWPKFNFWFWHGFYTKTETEKVLDIDKNMQRELDKLAYQRDKFKQLDPTNTLFFASNTQNNLTRDVFSNNETDLFAFSTQTQDDLTTSLSSYFGAPANLRFMSRKDRIQEEPSRYNNVQFLELEKSEWKGSDSIWNKALDRQLRNLLPNR